MKKTFLLGAICASIAAFTSCGGDSKPAAAAQPAETFQEEATVSSKTTTYETNGELTERVVKNFGANGNVVSEDHYLVSKSTKAEYLAEHIVYKDGQPYTAEQKDDNGKPDGSVTYGYNNGRLSNIVTKVNGKETLRYNYVYNANGDLTSVKELALKEGASKLSIAYEWTYQYDAQNRLSQRADFAGEGAERIQANLYEFEYVGETNKVSTVNFTFFDLNTKKLKHDAIHTFKYDKKDRPVEDIVERHNNNRTKMLNSRRFQWSYDDNGNLQGKFEERFNNNKWEANMATCLTEYYQYDEEGNLESVRTMVPKKNYSGYWVELSADAKPVFDAAQKQPTTKE